MDLTVSKAGLMALAAHEGIVLSPYRDSKGIWTIGVGHTAAAGYPDPAKFVGSFTLSEVLGLFRQDVAKYEKAVRAAVKVPVKQHEFDALVSFHYNTGAIGKATLTKLLNAGKRAEAGAAFMNWTKPPEITDRRKAERDLFLTGKYPAPFATIFPADSKGNVQWGKGKRVDLREALAAPADHFPDAGTMIPPVPVQPVPSVPVSEVALEAERLPVGKPEAKRGFLEWLIGLWK